MNGVDEKKRQSGQEEVGDYDLPGLSRALSDNLEGCPSGNERK